MRSVIGRSEFGGQRSEMERSPRVIRLICGSGLSSLYRLFIGIPSCTFLQALEALSLPAQHIAPCDVATLNDAVSSGNGTRSFNSTVTKA
jgi:hypothetical protein